MISGQGKMEQTKEGAMRESNEGRGRFDLIPYEALEALAKWYEGGSYKYAERNWEEGISVKDCINRMCRHAGKAASGWTDEDHLSAVMWNAAAAITMMQRKPEYNDHVWHYPQDENKPLLWSHDHSQEVLGKVVDSIISGDGLEVNVTAAYPEFLKKAFHYKDENGNPMSNQKIYDQVSELLHRGVGVKDICICIGINDLLYVDDVRRNEIYKFFKKNESVNETCIYWNIDLNELNGILNLLNSLKQED